MAVRRRKKYPPLRLIKAPEPPRLLEPIGFAEFARKRCDHWDQQGPGGPLDPQVRVLKRLFTDWAWSRDTDELLFERPDFTELARMIVFDNTKRIAVPYLRLVALNGTRVAA